MKKSIKKNKVSLLIVVALSFIMAIFVILLMRSVSNFLYTDVKINLEEVVIQNKNVITSKLESELSHLQNISDRLSDRMQYEQNAKDSMVSIFKEFCADTDNTKIYIADKNAICYFVDGTTLHIGGRLYYKKAIDGTKNISRKIVSWKDGEEIFVLSVPIIHKNEIIGTIQRPFSPEEMYQICSISLFSSQGFMYIIDSDGYIMLSSDEKDYSIETDNYYSLLTLKGNQESSNQLKKDILSKNNGFMQVQMEGNSILSAYTAIDSIDDWFLISSINTVEVWSNVRLVINLFYFILTAVVIVLMTIGFIFLKRKNKKRQEIEKIAFYDEVTKGNSFSKFYIYVTETLKNSTLDYSILVFDIDNFRYVNSYYGFQKGDAILSYIYSHILSRLTENEMVARVSADHFIVLLKSDEKERLERLLVFDFDLQEQLGICVSAGLYKITDKSESINLMMDKATTAAKTIKSDIYEKIAYYDKNYDIELEKRELLKRKIKFAVDNHEFVPFYQPKVNIHTGEIVGAEALARWISKDGTLISSSEFIDLSEKTGHIIRIDMMIFEAVLKFINNCIRQNIFCPPISVNFSRLHLLNKEFIHKLIAKIDAYQVPTNLIQIELTESIIFENNSVINEFVEHLHAHNLLVNIDDFGSGYSSLNILKDIPVDVLKIDRIFLANTENIKKQHLILSAINQMAKDLNMEVVLEGVETQENVQLMKEIHCDIAQGYHFSRPLKEEFYLEILKKGKL